MSASKTSRPGRKPDPALRSAWQQTLLRFEHSGLSAPAFCLKEGLSLPSFYAWRRRLQQHHSGNKAQPTDTPLLPIQILSSPPVELLLPQGTVLRLSPGCDLDFVRSLLGALQEDKSC